MRKIVPLILLVAGLLSCDDRRVFEVNKPIDGNFWYVDSLMVFDFDVDRADIGYNIYSNFSHTSEYTYYNLYYRYSLKDSMDQELSTDLVNIHFFDPKSGQPLGDGLGDVFDHQQLLLENLCVPIVYQILKL
jgi:gliding motility-associated lipoprotein GldH